MLLPDVWEVSDLRRAFETAFLFCFFMAVALTANAKGCVLPEDFSVRGVTLGETADEKILEKAFGAPLFDTDKSVFGIRVKYYTFKKKFSVGVAASTGKVVDIVIEDQSYSAREDVRYGATPHRISSGFMADYESSADGGRGRFRRRFGRRLAKRRVQRATLGKQRN